jgi:hypothetical protein
MALNQSRLPFLPRLREHRDVRRYRQHLLEGNVLARSAPLLPHLDRLPLMVQPAAGGPAMSLLAALELSPRIRLVSLPSSGRSLILRQLCLQWAHGIALPQVRLPFLYHLPANEPPTTPPFEIIRREFSLLGFEHNELMIKRGLAAGMWLFLLEGWDQMDAEHQTVWARWLTACAERYPALATVVSTGPLGQQWTYFDDWQIVGWEASAKIMQSREP